MFESIADSSFYEVCYYNPGRKNIGWIAYNYKRANDKATQNILGTKFLRIQTLLYELKSNNYFK